MMPRPLRGFVAAGACVAAAAAGAKQKAALVLVGVQDCHLDVGTSDGKPGTLPVEGASAILPVVNRIRKERECHFDFVARTYDFHPANHISFASTHGLPSRAHLGGRGGLPVVCVKPGSETPPACCPKQYVAPYSVDCTKQLCPPEGWTWASHNPAFVAANPACERCAAEPASCYDDVQALWPAHCLTTGDFHPPRSLVTEVRDRYVATGSSSFSDAPASFMDMLQASMVLRGVEEIHFAGVATDNAFKAIVRSALRSTATNFTVKVIGDATAVLPEGGGSPGDAHRSVMDALTKEGAVVVASAELLAQRCEATNAFKKAYQTVRDVIRDQNWGPFIFMGASIVAAAMII